MDEFSEHNLIARSDVLITKFLAGETNHKEEEELKSWIDLSDENKNYFIQLKHIWNSAEQINVAENQAFVKIKKQTKGFSTWSMLWKYWQKVAAVLLIPALLGTILMLKAEKTEQASDFSKQQTITAPFGTFSSLQLPDGTKVWLNAGSKITFPQKFDTKSRRVDLIGEAYFEVVSNEQQPFFVNTPGIHVKATGTKFSVRSFNGDITPRVALAEGKVSVTRAGSTTAKKVYLKPNQVLTYEKGKSVPTVSNEDVYKCYAWKDGKLVFRNDPFNEVARRISIQYNVDIELRGNKIKDYRYRATFANETLDDLLRLLKLSSPFAYKQVPAQRLADGTYTKKKIIISTTE